MKENSLVLVTNQGYFIHVTELGSENLSIDYKKSKYDSFRLVDSSYLTTPNSYNGKQFVAAVTAQNKLLFLESETLKVTKIISL